MCRYTKFLDFDILIFTSNYRGGWSLRKDTWLHEHPQRCSEHHGLEIGNIFAKNPEKEMYVRIWCGG